jgi:hypothetical protein
MNNENDNNLNFNEVLNILDNASKESFVKEAWIPSLKRTVKIKEINAKQQKSIIESAIDSAVIKSTFSKVPGTSKVLLSQKISSSEFNANAFKIKP